jgi:hypothetical protein
MFWIFKLIFVVDILACFDLATFWAIFKKFGEFFFLSFGHTAHDGEVSHGANSYFEAESEIKTHKRYFFYVGSHLEQN